MKKNTVKIIALSLAAVLSIAAAVVFGFPLVKISDDFAVNTLSLSVLARAPACALLLAVWILYFGSRRKSNIGKSLLFSLPCFAVAVANFPFYALIFGGAKVSYPQLIPLFALDCLFVALLEELVFRGFLLSVIGRLFSKSRFGRLWAMLLSSAVFALTHLANLFYGGDILPTLMQVGYSFAIGCMLCILVFKTGRISLCVGVHAVFNFGGNLISALGSGSPHDACFWILTAACAVFCAACLAVDTFRFQTLKSF